MPLLFSCIRVNAHFRFYCSFPSPNNAGLGTFSAPRIASLAQLSLPFYCSFRLLDEASSTLK
jgi:hypothetical protein